MIARIFSSMAFFSAIKAGPKYEIFKGKYLVPVAPKRPLSAYILFSNDARKALAPPAEGQKVSIATQSKDIAEKWKNITPEQKAKYDAKAAELRKQYEIQHAKYKGKFVQPFTKVNYNTLFMKEFYLKNKYSSLTQGNEAMKKFKQTMKEQDWVKYKKLAEDQNKQNQKIIKNYAIPQKQYKTLNAFIRHLHKEGKAPLKSEMDEETLKKVQKKYEDYQTELGLKLKAFANSFHITVPDLKKMIKKEKDPIQIIDEQTEAIKKAAKLQKEKADLEYRKSKEKLATEKQKIQKKLQRESGKVIKTLEKEVQKNKKKKLKLTAKITGKVTQLKRKKTEALTDKSIQKQLTKKTRKSKAKTEPAATTTAETPVTQTTPPQPAATTVPPVQPAQPVQPVANQATTQTK